MDGERIVNDGPEDRCFGCGHANPRGLRMVFRRTAEGIECEYTAPDHLAGAPGVVHGGVQAALLDEVLGMAAHGPEERLHLVTVDFRLRYRRPAATGAPLRVRGRLVRVEGRDRFLEGEILDGAGEVLTRAEARWRALPPDSRRPA